MKNESVTEFLKQPHLLNLATLTPDGFPHVTPVWFDYDGEDFLISTTQKRKKTRNLRHDKNAGFSIAPVYLPYAAVVGYGTVKISPDAEYTLTEKLCYKYLPVNKAPMYFEILKSGQESRVKLTLHPTWMTSWQG